VSEPGIAPITGVSVVSPTSALTGPGRPVAERPVGRPVAAPVRVRQARSSWRRPTHAERPAIIVEPLDEKLLSAHYRNTEQTHHGNSATARRNLGR
jgi:hypothetical protein